MLEIRPAPAATKRPCSPATSTKCTPLREAKGWKVEDMDMNRPTGRLQGNNPRHRGGRRFRAMQYESGGHRVQHVPKTEAKGRIHTSAATVAVMPEPEDVEIDQGCGQLERMPARRARRPARQQDRKRRPADPLGHGTGSQVPGRKQPAQELRPGPCACSRAGCTRGTRSSIAETIERSPQRRSAPATAANASAPTISRRTPHRPPHQPELQSGKRDCRQPGAGGRGIDRVSHCQAQRAAFGNIE